MAVLVRISRYSSCPRGRIERSPCRPRSGDSSRHRLRNWWGQYGSLTFDHGALWGLYVGDAFTEMFGDRLAVLRPVDPPLKAQCYKLRL